MFGFSIPKIIFTAAVIAAVWYGFKWLNRRQQVEAERAQAALNKGGAEAPDVEEMVPCPDCGAYVAKGGDHRCT